MFYHRSVSVITFLNEEVLKLVGYSLRHTNLLWLLTHVQFSLVLLLKRYQSKFVYDIYKIQRLVLDEVLLRVKSCKNICRAQIMWQ